MANAFCSQLRQYVKQLVSNPQPCLVSQTARLHVGDARNRFCSLLHSWSSEKPVESLHKRQASDSLPLMLTVDEVKLIVLRDDVALPLPSDHGAGNQLNARYRGSPRQTRFHESSRRDTRQKECCGRNKREKPNSVNPDPEPGNKPNPELEVSPRSMSDQDSQGQPSDRRPPAKSSRAYAPPMNFYVTKTPMAKMSESMDFARRNLLGGSTRNFSSLTVYSASKVGLLESVQSNQIKGYHATACNNRDRNDRDRDKNRDKEAKAIEREREEREREKERENENDKERKREKDRVRSRHKNVTEETRDNYSRQGGRMICAGKRPEPQDECAESCPCSSSREQDSRRMSMSEPEQCSDSAVDEPDSRRRGRASVQEPEWRKKTAVREPHSRRLRAPVEEPRSGDDSSARSRCSGSEPWKRECPGSNRLRKCPGGSCGRGDRDPERKSYSSYALRSISDIPVLNHLRYSKSEITKSIGGESVLYAKKKGGCDDKYTAIKDKKRRMKIMSKELDEIKNCIDSVKCKFRKSPKDDKESGGKR